MSRSPERRGQKRARDDRERDRDRDRDRARNRNRDWDREQERDWERRDRGGQRERDTRDRWDAHDARDGRGRREPLRYDDEPAKRPRTRSRSPRRRTDQPAARGVAFDLGTGQHVRPEKEPEVELSTPVDEEAEIQRRRQRREEILKRSREAAESTPAATPMAVDQPADQAADQAADQPIEQPIGPATPKPTTPEGPQLDLEDGAFLGKHAVTTDTGDGPSAADYDPTVDMAIDERRDEIRHESVKDKKDAAVPATTDDDDDDDMFAEDFVEKTYEAAAVKDTAAAAAPGGGILDGDDYQGYYKIRPGEMLDGRYQVQTALGKGMFSGVALARDTQSADGREVAIKMMRNNDALRKGGYREIAILEKLNAADPEDRRHIVRFERAFDYRGHLCMAFESLSMNLREVLKKFGNNVGISLAGVRVFGFQIFVALAHMRRCSIIHADLKPDNILVNARRTAVKICDLGTAIDRADAVTAHTEVTPYLVSRFYRAPEIILGAPYDYAVDTWSIGCTLYELYTGKILFAGESNNQMLRAIMEVRGRMSVKLHRRGELWPMHFDDTGAFLSHETDKFQAKTTVRTLATIKPTRDLRTRLLAASTGLDDAESRDLQHFCDLLDKCLTMNPDKRIQPADALKHPFFTEVR